MHDTNRLLRNVLLSAFVALTTGCGDRPAAPTVTAAPASTSAPADLQATAKPPSTPVPTPAPGKSTAPLTDAKSPEATATPPTADEDSYTAHGEIPEGVDVAGLRGDAYFFTAAGREGKPVAIVPVTVGLDRSVSAVDIHHHPGEAMITEVRLESPTWAPWWSIAWPDGRIAIGQPLGRADAIRLHGILTTEEDGAALPDVRIFGDIAGTILGRSDDQGQFECWVPKAQHQVHLLPFASTLVGHSRFVDATAYDDQDIRFQVERGVRIRFLVTDTTGTPLPGAVVIWTGGASYQGKTDQNGEVAIGMVSRSAPHEPTVVLAGYEPLTPIGKVVAADYVDHPLVIIMTPSRSAPEP